MSASAEDWASVLERLLEGDRLALLKLTRLLNSFLARWNAYDFRDDWDDLIQEVVLAAALASREGRIREPKAVIGYLRTTLRFKYVDRLRSQLRGRPNAVLPWGDAVEVEDVREAERPADEMREDMRRALEKIPEKKRAALLEVYVRGRTYEEASRHTGIPLGTLKRYLRDALGVLRHEFASFLEEG